MFFLQRKWMKQESDVYCKHSVQVLHKDRGWTSSRYRCRYLTLVRIDAMMRLNELKRWVAWQRHGSIERSAVEKNVESEVFEYWPFKQHIFHKEFWVGLPSVEFRGGLGLRCLLRTWSTRQTYPKRLSRRLNRASDFDLAEILEPQDVGNLHGSCDLQTENPNPWPPETNASSMNPEETLSKPKINPTNIAPAYTKINWVDPPES